MATPIDNQKHITIKLSSLAPTVEQASIILAEYIDCELSTEPDQIISEWFGISNELYLSAIFDNVCGFLNDDLCWEEPKPSDKNISQKGFSNVFIMGDFFGYVEISADVPDWFKLKMPDKKSEAVDEKEGVYYIECTDEILKKLPKRGIKDLHPTVYGNIIDTIMGEINTGIQWIHTEKTDDGGDFIWFEGGYEHWYNTISLNPEEIVDICVSIRKVLTMPFGEFIKECGYTKSTFSKRYRISTYTLDEWIYRNPPKLYLRLLFAESNGLLPSIKPDKCDHAVCF